MTRTGYVPTRWKSVSQQVILVNFAVNSAPRQSARPYATRSADILNC